MHGLKWSDALLHYSPLRLMSSPAASPSTAEPWLEVVRQKVAGIRFGSVQITVHEGRVTQVESLEKTRFSATGDDATDPQRVARRL